jgi:hypothetical protein
VADRWGCLRRALCPGVAGSEDRQQERYRGSDEPHKSPKMPSLVRQVLILSLQRRLYKPTTLISMRCCRCGNEPVMAAEIAPLEATLRAYVDEWPPPNLP